MQLTSLTIKPVDHRAVAKEVYAFAESQAPLAPLVKEALETIDDAVNDFGYDPTRTTASCVTHSYQQGGGRVNQLQRRQGL